MRGTRSDNVIFEDCRIPEGAVIKESFVPSVGDLLRTYVPYLDLP